MTGAIAILRLPRRLAQAKGRFAVTTPEGAVVLAAEVGTRGRIVDLAGPDATPAGRILEVRGRHWQLLDPGTGLPVAHAELRNGVQVSIAGGPWAEVDGRGDEWDLVWERTTLLAVRKTDRKIAKRSLDVWVTDPACTPAVVAFVVHVRTWAVAANEAATAALT
ncbi:hypothetical protein ACXR2U_04330 [Jatrophihabitans sp. YIM 134969]